MIRYYLCPVVDDGVRTQDGYGLHAKVLDYLSYEFGTNTAAPGWHVNGWTMCFVNRTDHSELDAAPDVDDVLQGALDVVTTKAGALARAELPLPANRRDAVLATLVSRGIDSAGLTTAREVLDRVLHSVDPAAKLEDLGVG